MLFSVVMDISWSLQICLKQKREKMIAFLSYILPPNTSKRRNSSSLKTHLGWDLMESLAVKAKQYFLHCIFFFFNPKLTFASPPTGKNWLLASEQPLSWWPYQREMLLVWKSCWWEMGREKTWIYKIQQQQIFFFWNKCARFTIKGFKNRENKSDKLCKSKMASPVTGQFPEWCLKLMNKSWSGEIIFLGRYWCFAKFK